MDTLFAEQINFILNRGAGIKACLFDEESKQLISNTIPYSIFQDNNFFYFDYLKNKKRVPIVDLTCVVIIRPESLKSLIEELSNPFYSNYIVLFTNQIDPFALEILANADVKSAITEIHEIYLDAVKQDEYLYTVGSCKYRRVLDGLFSLLMSLEIHPSIKIILEKSPENGFLQELGRELNLKSLQYNFKKKGTVVLLKRNFDLVSPLLCDWHYQSLLAEYLKLDNGTIKIDGKEYSLNDKFFEKNKFEDINKVAQEITEMVRELERNKIKIGNHEFEDIEEKAAHSRMVETHLKAYNAVLERCLASKVLSEAEMAVVQTDTLGTVLGNFQEKEQLKLLLLHFLSRGTDWKEESKKYPRFRDILLKYKEIHQPQTFPYKPTFDTTKDIKLGYESPVKKLLKHILNDKVRPGALKDLGSSEVSAEPIIVYIEGGVSMREYRDAMKYASEAGAEIYIVSDRILTAESIMNSLMK